MESVEGITTTISSDKVSIKYDNATNETLEIILSVGQVQVDAITVTYLSVLDHAHIEEPVVKKDASCTENGHEAGSKCPICDKIMSGMDEIPATGHSYGEWETVTDSTCTTKGSQERTCSVCGAVESQELELGEHNYGANGKCASCGQEENTSSPDTDTLNIFGSNGTMSSDNNSISWATDKVTVINTKGSTAIRTSDSDHFRVYANSEVDISVDEGLISKIVFTITESKYVSPMVESINQVDGCSATNSGNTVTVIVNNLQTITFTATAQTRINKVEVTYK